MRRRVHIVGAGLAGLALGGALLRRGVPVVLHEKGPHPRNRVCGAFIRGLDAETMEELELEPELQEAQWHRSVVWHVAGEQLLRMDLPDAVPAISRQRLETRLRERFLERGGCWEEGRVKPEGCAVGWVWAGGRARRAESPWCGLKVHSLRMPLQADLEMHVGRGGYVGLTPVEGDRVNIAALLRGPLPRVAGTAGEGVRFCEVLRASGLEGVAERLAQAEVEAGSFRSVAGLEFGWQRTEPNCCGVGDAAVFMPPFTGHGMAMALQGAAIALPDLVAFAEGRLDWGDAQARIERGMRCRFSRKVRVALGVHQLLLMPGLHPWFPVAHRLGCLPVQRVLRWLS